MGSVFENTIIKQTTDAQGNITETRVVDMTKIEKGEPPFIKLYCDSWMGMYNIPNAYKQLFLALAQNMSACDSANLKYSQLVSTGVPFADYYMRICGWKSIDSLKKGLQALCDCDAIRRVARGTYQVNPTFACKGRWLDGKGNETAFSGIKRFITEYDWVSGTVKTTITHNDPDKYFDAVTLSPQAYDNKYSDDSET
jgi:hypothetical protein